MCVISFVLITSPRMEDTIMEILHSFKILFSCHRSSRSYSKQTVMTESVVLVSVSSAALHSECKRERIVPSAEEIMAPSPPLSQTCIHLG